MYNPHTFQKCCSFDRNAQNNKIIDTKNERMLHLTDKHPIKPDILLTIKQKSMGVVNGKLSSRYPQQYQKNCQDFS